MTFREKVEYNQMERELGVLRQELRAERQIRDRYEEALNRMIYDKEIRTLFHAVQEAKRALGVLEDE